jgi:radial spoke head protein 9
LIKAKEATLQRKKNNIAGDERETMDQFTFKQGISNFISSQGSTLSSKEDLGLSLSLHKLSGQVSTSKVYFWGRIRGASQDYYIAYYWTEGEKKFLVSSGNQFDFKPIASINSEQSEWLQSHHHHTIEFSGNLSQRLTPEPTPEEEQQEEETDPSQNDQSETAPADPATDDNENQQPPSTNETATTEEKPKKKKKAPVEVFESHKLAQTISSIERDTSLVPFGSFILNDAGVIVEDNTFKGLTYQESLNLANYYHLRVQHPGDFQDFMPCIVDDLPRNQWVIRNEIGATVIRSLLWPGYSFYHTPGTPYFGGVYIGDGIKQADLAFLLM